MVCTENNSIIKPQITFNILFVSNYDFTHLFNENKNTTVDLSMDDSSIILRLSVMFAALTIAFYIPIWTRATLPIIPRGETFFELI